MNKKNKMNLAPWTLALLVTSSLINPHALMATPDCVKGEPSAITAQSSIQNLKAIAQFASKDIGEKDDIEIKKNEMETRPDFELNKDRLNKGKFQAFNILLEKKELKNHPEVLALIEKMDLNDLLKDNVERISVLKLAYIIPKAKAEKFTLKQLTNKDYIEQTNKKLKHLSPLKGANNLRTEKVVPIFDNVETEFVLKSTNPEDQSPIEPEKLAKIGGLTEGFGMPDNIGLSEQVDSNDPIVNGSQSINLYYNLPNDEGTLVVTYTLASITIDNLPWKKRLALKAVPDTMRLGQFIDETSFMIGENRKFFSKK